MERALFASGLSTRSDTAEALEEAAAALLRGLCGRRPDLVVAFASTDHAVERAQLGRRVRRATDAAVLLGCTGEGIVGGEREVEGEPALALWGVACPDAHVRSFRCEARVDERGEVGFDALPVVRDPERATLLLLADPFTFPMPEYLSLANQRLPSVPAIGGMASGGHGPGQNALWLDDAAVDHGAIGAVIEGGIELHPVVSQGCRPVGRPYVITRVEGNLIQKLGGRAGARVLGEVLNEIPPEDRALFQRGPFLGLAVDANKSRFERGDFLVRGLLGIQQSDGALAVAEGSLRAGQTVQFLVRDAASAGEDLSQLLARERERIEVRESAGELGALVFTCNGRGSRMFPDEPNHDVGRVQRAFGGSIPAAGFFAMGEIGPVGGQNFLHGFTASVALFRGRPD